MMILNNFDNRRRDVLLILLGSDPSNRGSISRSYIGNGMDFDGYGTGSGHGSGLGGGSYDGRGYGGGPGTLRPNGRGSGEDEGSSEQADVLSACFKDGVGRQAWGMD